MLEKEKAQCIENTGFLIGGSSGVRPPASHCLPAASSAAIGQLSERSLRECSQDIPAYAHALAGSNPTSGKRKKQILSYLLALVDHQGFEPWTP